MAAPSAVKLSLSTSCSGFVAAFFAGAFLVAAFLGGVSARRLSSSSMAGCASPSEFSSSLIGVGGFLVAAFVVLVGLRVVCFLRAAAALAFGAVAFFAGAAFFYC